MDEDRRAERLGGLKDREQRRVVEIRAVYVRADLYARHAQLAHAAFQLAHGEAGVLHRQRAEADETRRLIGDDSGDVVVQQSRQVERVLRLGPIAEHHRHGR